MSVVVRILCVLLSAFVRMEGHSSATPRLREQSRRPAPTGESQILASPECVGEGSAVVVR